MTTQQTTIALDAMGGDFGPQVVVPAAAKALEQYPNVRFLLVGRGDSLSPLIKKYLSRYASRYEIIEASEVVGMDEPPALALRNKKHSSMRLTINSVKEGKAQACVSAGNTGALMATARFVLKTLPGVDRPAICTAFPAENKKLGLRFLDLGANVDSSAQHLFQFAVMGSVLASLLDQKDNPRVALLNVGSEEIKGNEIVKAANQLFISKNAFNYIGYLEGDKVFSDAADVLVCDGFVGNVALKSIEGTVRFIGRLIRESVKKSWLNRILALLSAPLFKQLAARIHPERYNGAMLLGLNGTVIKSHGGANTSAYYYAIVQAIEAAKHNVPEKIRAKVQHVLAEGETK